MKVCHMCGKETNKMQNRWYKYDNGEHFIAGVCTNCAQLHDKLVSAS